eukprot:3938897-Rhodomonas_salina.2
MPRYLRWRAGSTCCGQSAFERRVPGSSGVLTVAQPHIPYKRSTLSAYTFCLSVTDDASRSKITSQPRYCSTSF